MSNAPDLSRVAVVIPALNEEPALGLVLDALPAVGCVVVADNGSTDATAAVARSRGAHVVVEPRRGYGNACLAGIARALLANPDVIVILDADHSCYADDLAPLVAPILAGRADLVLGDRTRRAERGALLPLQRAGNVVTTALIAAITGHRYRDMGPFRAVRTSALLALEMVDPNYGWNVEMQMKAVRRGLRIQEIPVGYRPRVGRSKVSGTVRGSLAAGGKMLLSTWRYAR